jgi:hypothetical protein
MVVHVSVVILALLGALAGLLLLLNHRDRRAAALCAIVWAAAPRELVGRITIEARSALLWSSRVAHIDMWSCTHDDVWRALALWQAALPARDRLQVRAHFDGAMGVAVTLATQGCPRANRASAIDGIG